MFKVDFQTKLLYAFLIYISRPSHLLLDHGLVKITNYEVYNFVIFSF
jgi:hypothetical protein